MSLDDQRRILVQTILEHPEDDDARLIYADYLQQLGDPRGELIAMQTRNAHGATEEVEAVERQLLDDHADEWLGPWHQRVFHWRFRRGFLHELKVSYRAFFDVANQLDPLSDHLAHIRSLHLVDPGANGGQVASVLQTMRVQALVLEAWQLHANDANVLAGEQCLSHLTKLRLERIANEPLMILARSNHLKPTTFELHDATRIVDAVLIELARLPFWKRIRRFAHTAKYMNVVGEAGIAALVETNRQLTHLDLAGQYGFDDAAFSALARRAPPLVALSLGHARVTSDTIAMIGRFDQLRTLDVRHTRLGDSSLEPILALPHLEMLNIAHTPMTVAAARTLLRHAPPSLRDLTITIPNLPPALVDQLRARFDLHRWR